MFIEIVKMKSVLGLLMLTSVALCNPWGFRNLPANYYERLNSPDLDQNAEQLSGQFEGDMVLSYDQWSNRNGVSNEKFRWNASRIAYEFHEGFTDEQRDQIRAALTVIENETCLEFYPKSDEDVNYIWFNSAIAGCWSYIGRIGGKQELNLQPGPLNTGCMVIGTIIHETLHALGFFHMHNASPRDDYVTIGWDNIAPSSKGNFILRTDTSLFGVPYDYDSLMHYDRKAFSFNGLETITPHDTEAFIGQRNKISEYDVARINAMYNCLD